MALFLGGGVAAIVVAVVHRGAAPRETMDAQAVYNRVEPSVVDVTSSLPYAAETAEGTGFVIDATRGLVLTNNHVIDGATSVTATLVATGRSYHARVVGDNADDDVALLRLQGATRLTAAPLGTALSASPGATVLGIGNSGGQGGSPAIVPGHISNLSRTISAVDETSGLTETLRDMLQVTARIQPGDSGGPLADAAGQVIGVDTAATQPTPGQPAQGFAIPIGAALTDARRIIDGRAGPGVTIGLPAFLGVVVGDRADPEASDQVMSHETSGCITMTQETGIPARVAKVRYGALVEGALCGTAAATAGLGSGDVITAVGARTVGSARTLREIMDGLRPGQDVRVRWVAVRGANRGVTVRLGVGPAR